MNYQARDEKYIWHPFTQHQTTPPSITIIRGDGAFLYDENGKAYLDAVSSWWTNLHGHSHPHLAAALYEQART
jgi:adenosylmethionine-8-amino-7-oxononanoate aminotransferase